MQADNVGVRVVHPIFGFTVKGVCRGSTTSNTCNIGAVDTLNRAVNCNAGADTNADPPPTLMVRLAFITPPPVSPLPAAIVRLRLVALVALVAFVAVLAVAAFPVQLKALLAIAAKVPLPPIVRVLELGLKYSFESSVTT